MLTARFHRLFRRLVSVFLRYDDIPRSSETVVEIAQARAVLEDARVAIAAERNVVARRAARTGRVRYTSVSAANQAILDVQGMIAN